MLPPDGALGTEAKVSYDEHWWRALVHLAGTNALWRKTAGVLV